MQKSRSRQQGGRMLGSLWRGGGVPFLMVIGWKDGVVRKGERGKKRGDELC